MGIGNIIVTILFSYYSIYFIDLFNKNKRLGIQIVNKELDKLRKIPLKTLEEQKQFINMKYPKKQKGRFSWSVVPRILLKLVIFFVLFQAWLYLLVNIIGYEFPLWLAILFVMVLPILINLVLAKFDVQKYDMLAFLKKY